MENVILKILKQFRTLLKYYRKLRLPAKAACLILACVLLMMCFDAVLPKDTRTIETYDVDNILYEDTRYLAIGFDDFRPSDFSLVIPLFAEYGARAEYNIITNVSVSPETRKEQFEAVFSNGNELGDHTWNHREFIYTDPLFNGQDPDSPEGDQVPYPSNEELRGNRGDGKNVFGYDIHSKVNDAMDIWKLELDASWAELTDEECQYIRDSFSVYKNANGMCELLDWMSNWFLGTTGSSYGSYDEAQGCYTGGIFTGARTSSNHEIWERILEITALYYKNYLEMEEPFRVWSKPGDLHSPCTYENDGKRYYDPDFLLPYNYQAKMKSSLRTDENGAPLSRSWNDVLREYGYTSTHDSLYPGRNDGFTKPAMAYQFFYNASLSRNDGVVFPTNSAVPYAALYEAYPESFFVPDNDYGIQMIKDKGVFFDLIESLRHNTAHGLIQGEVIDSDDTFSERVILEELLKFCNGTGIKLIPKSEAYDLCFHTMRTEGNLIYNPKLRCTIEEYYGRDPDIPSNPDGYVGVCHTEEMDTGKRMLVTEELTEYVHFGIPTGTIVYQAEGKGNGVIRIYAIRNNSPFDLNTEQLELLKEVPVNSNSFKIVSAEFAIPDVPADGTDLQYDGLGEKIMGIKIVYPQGIRVYDIGLFMK
ncbi:MAG: polysaccharide deacetylase family protein [Solobacterium sp.]|nr:polysaccharide deacetylase family protein [Solobacterium sp.]